MRSKFSIKGHPLHPILVSLPIGLFVWVLVADIVYIRSGDPLWFGISTWSAIAAIVTALLAALPGFGDYFTMARYSRRASGLATAHMLLNLLVVGLYIVAAILVRGLDPATGVGYGMVVALHAIGVVALSISGWLGGEMVFRHRIGVDEAIERTPARPYESDLRKHDVPLRRAGS